MHDKSYLNRMNRRSRCALILTLALTGAGCSMWRLGPEPDNYVGRARREDLSQVVPPTDAALSAVRPVVPGDTMAPVLPGVTSRPSTMPAATEPTTVAPG